MEKNSKLYDSENRHIYATSSGRKLEENSPIRAVLSHKGRLLDGYHVDHNGNIVENPTVEQLKSGELELRIFDTLTGKRVTGKRVD